MSNDEYVTISEYTGRRWGELLNTAYEKIAALNTDIIFKRERIEGLGKRLTEEYAKHWRVWDAVREVVPPDTYQAILDQYEKVEEKFEAIVKEEDTEDDYI